MKRPLRGSRPHRAFKYTPRTKQQIKERASQRGGAYNSLLREDIPFFGANEEGGYTIRILPATWENPKHYGVECFVHYGVGPENQRYLCLNKMDKGDCPVCEEWVRATASDDIDTATALSPKKRVAVWLIDRGNEDDGPLAWFMPWTVDRDINAESIDRRTGEYFLIEDPEEGYDIEFRKVRSGQWLRYQNVQPARKSTPLHDDQSIADAWIAFVVNNPLVDCMEYYDYDHINKVLSAKAEAEKKELKAEDVLPDTPDTTGQSDYYGDGESDDKEVPAEEETVINVRLDEGNHEDENDEDEDEDEDLQESLGLDETPVIVKRHRKQETEAKPLSEEDVRRRLKKLRSIRR